ncbi:dopamine receptor 4-like [Patiria miniata]|uniref:G-protein coupled receptors family 1 profile domain-containing protein n=1 Tax=Patiria miniata TaxID=46514 RepID=A0A913ZTY1_PATMI|nr:dopamine receptor 4-like [Patiria miniata]
MKMTIMFDYSGPPNGTADDGFDGSASPLTAFTVIQAVAICIFAFLTVAGNTLIILSIVRFRVLQTITSAFILNLAIVDFSVGVTLMPVALITCVKQDWILGDVFCKISGVVNMLFPVASISTLSVIAIDRYCAIIRPLKYNSFMTRRTVTVFLIWVWVQSLLIALLPLTPWSQYRYDPSELLCLIAWDSSDLSFAIFCLFVCIVVPLGVMFFCYYHILRVARHHSRRVQALKTISTNVSACNHVQADSDAHGGTPRTSDTRHECQSHRCHQHRPKIRIAARENKSTAMMMMVVGTFILAWLPYITGALCKVIARECLWPESYFTACVLVAMLQSSLNPVIYGVMDRRFRGAMKAIVTCSSRTSVDPVINRPHFSTSVL